MPKRKKKPQHVAYFTRHLRTDLRDRLRITAWALSRETGSSISMEEVLNIALEYGLRVIEPNLRQQETKNEGN